MSEDDSRDIRRLLDTALTGEPLSEIDPTSLLRKGKRRVRLHRASAALGAVVIAGGIALGASMIHPGGTNQPAQSYAGSNSQAPSPRPNMMALENTLNQTLSSAYQLPTGTSVSSGKLAFVSTNDVAPSELNARLSDRSGSGQLHMTVMVSAIPLSSAAIGPTVCSNDPLSCQLYPVDGVTIEVQTDHPTPNTTRVITTASVGGAIINGEMDNTTVGNDMIPSSPEPPLSIDQLVHITAQLALAISR